MSSDDLMQTGLMQTDPSQTFPPSILSRSLKEEGEAGEHEAYLPLFFLFTSIMIGVALKETTIPYLRKIPFTGLLFAFWLCVSAWHTNFNTSSGFGLGSLGKSIETWIAIDPHLILFCFLPPLLFADSYATDSHLFLTRLPQIMILATIGVILGTVMLASLFKYVMPYEWSWNLCLVMGSILSATDPVAVVSLLKDLGAPPALTMVISGESMMNDGTSIVMFNLFISLYTKQFNIPGGVSNHDYSTFTEILLYSIRSICGGALIGAAGAFVSITFLIRFDSKLKENNSILQLTTTLSMAYLTFYVAESSFGTSGVIATVIYGILFSEFSRGLVVSREVLNSGWETFEFMGNTLIFSLAGLICGDIISSSKTLELVDWHDFLYIILTWACAIISRMIMLILVHPLCKLASRNQVKALHAKHNAFKDMIVSSWGGLRGAVGLSLAILVRNQNIGSDQEKNGVILLLHVAGVATLTLLINATTATPLLIKLGMTKVPASHQIAVKRIAQKITYEIQVYAESLLNIHNDQNLDEGVDAEGVHGNRGILSTDLAGMCNVLKDSMEKPFLKITTEAMLNQSKRGGNAWEMRDLFLKLVRSGYKDMIELRSIILPPERHEASRILLNSTLVATDDLSELRDWDYLKDSMEANKNLMFFFNLIDKCNAACNITLHDGPLGLRYLYSKRQSYYAILLGFETAHIAAQVQMADIFRLGDEDAAAVIEESMELVLECRQMRKNMSGRLKRRVALEHLAMRVLAQERHTVNELTEHGVLLSKDEEFLLVENEKDQNLIKKASSHLASDLAAFAHNRACTLGGKINDADKSRRVYINEGEKNVASNRNMHHVRTKSHPVDVELGVIGAEGKEPANPSDLRSRLDHACQGSMLNVFNLADQYHGHGGGHGTGERLSPISSEGERLSPIYSDSSVTPPPAGTEDIFLDDTDVGVEKGVEKGVVIDRRGSFNLPSLHGQSYRTVFTMEDGAPMPMPQPHQPPMLQPALNRHRSEPEGSTRPHVGSDAPMVPHFLKKKEVRIVVGEEGVEQSAVENGESEGGEVK